MNEAVHPGLLTSVSAPGAGMVSVLGALLAPESPQRFLREFWPERVFHAHGSPSRLPAPFNAPELSSFSALASCYRGRIGFGRGAKSPRMIMLPEQNPAHLYELGLSVYLPDLADYVPGTEPFLRALEAELGIDEFSCHMTVWASPEADGAAMHFDGEDVISVQLAGTKLFEVGKMREYAFPYGPQYGPGGSAYDDMYPQLERGFPDPGNVEWQGVEMKPGSVLFVPRGTWHRTRAERDSFAISIGIRPPCPVDLVLDQLKSLLLQDPEWRRPLYGVRGDVQCRRRALERAQKAFARAQAAMAALSAEDLAPLPEAERLRNIGRNARFQRDLGSRMAFAAGVGAETLDVFAWRREEGEKNTLKMNVPPQFAPVFRWLADAKTAFSAGELADRFPAVSFEQVQKILDVLTRARYLRMLWFSRLPGA